MTDFNNNNKFIPKLPETKTEYVLNEEQPRQQEQKSATEKIVDSVTNAPSVVKEAVVPAIHASDDKDKGKGSSGSGRGSPKIVQADNKWARDWVSGQRERDKQNAIENSQCDIQ